MKNSEVLKEAKKRIKECKDEYVCHAIDAVCNSYFQRTNLKYWVSIMLAPRRTYEGWVADYHPEIYKRMHERNFRKGRLQWLDWMIAECEKEEANANPSSTTTG